MVTNDPLKDVIDSIKKCSAAKGISVTEEEMAGKIGLSAEQLHAYLNGEAEIPAGLPYKLQSAYGIGDVMAWSTKIIQPPAPPPPPDESTVQDDPVIIEKNRNSLKRTIKFIKDLGVGRGMTITEEEMAGKAGLPVEQLYAYLDGDDSLQDDLTHKLFSSYQYLLDAVHQENHRTSLKTSIVKIRNCGLAKGMNITLENMIDSMGISGEQLYAYLNEEDKIPDDLPLRLDSAYKALFEGKGQAVKMEDIYL